MAVKPTSLQSRWGAIEGGNLWFAEEGFFSADPSESYGDEVAGLTAEDFLEGCSVAILNTRTQCVIGAGTDASALRDGALQRDLDPASHRITLAPSVFRVFENEGVHFTQCDRCEE